jgi:uncharacterized membrane-anchored protein
MLAVIDWGSLVETATSTVPDSVSLAIVAIAPVVFGIAGIMLGLRYVRNLIKAD